MVCVNDDMIAIEVCVEVTDGPHYGKCLQLGDAIVAFWR